MGVLTSKNAIKRLSIKLGEYSGQYLTSLAFLDKLKIACTEDRVAKKEAWTLRKSFLDEKIARKVNDRSVTTENMVKMMERKQRSNQEGVESRQIRGKNNKQPVLKVEITDFVTGITTTVHTQEEIVAAAVELNLRCQSKTIGTAFRQPALFNASGSCADNGENCLGVLTDSLIHHEDADPRAVSLLESVM